jgi:diguanylate cyclase (GGDEF)-like protein/PAS domain S-box-containing protein
MNPPAVRMLGVIAVFGVLCLTLITWAELRWHATLIDTHQPERLIGAVRLHLQSAELQIARDPGARTSASVDGALDNAYLASTALLDQMQRQARRSDDATRMAQAAQACVEQVDRLRQALRQQPGTDPRQADITLQALHMDLDRSVMDLERQADGLRRERLRQQGLLNRVTLVLVALGTLALLLQQQHHARQHERTLRELARRESHLRAFASAMPDVSFVLDAKGTYLEVYGQSDKLAAPAATLIGRNYHTFVPPDAAQRIDAMLRRTLTTREVASTEYSLDLRGKTHWFEARAHALPDTDDRVVAISWDISERKHNEARIRTLGRLYSFLSQVNQSIVWTRSPPELFERICRVALSHGDFTMAWVAQVDEGGLHLVPVAQAGQAQATASEHLPCILRLDAPKESPQHPALRCWRSGHLRWDTPPEARSQAVALPVTCDERITAVLVLVREGLDPEDAEEQALFQEIAADLSFALTQFRRREQWREGQDRNRLHAAALESTQDGVIVSDMRRMVVSVNRAFTEITGYSAQEAIGSTPAFLHCDRNPADIQDTIRATVLDAGRWQGELWSRRRDGTCQMLWCSVATVSDEQGLPTHFVSVFTDITAKKEAEARLRDLAHLDSLTGLPNRLMILSRMSHALAAAQRQRHKVAVLYIDLDNFKNVNDSLGHSAGDQLLLGVAQRLAQRTRRDDTLGRLGGDEFIVLLETLRDGEDAGAIAQELLHLLSRPFDVGPSEVYVQASIGISLFPDDGSEVEDLLRDADTAMYQAKRAGRGTYRYYTEALTQAAQVRLQLDTRLRRALERDEFQLWYQPLYSLASQRLIGLEALVRLHQPGLPPVGPAEFIPVLEDTGHIVALGEWVTNEACRQGRAWLDEGLDFGCIAVNISAVEMQRGGTVARVQKALDTHSLPAHHLELEITESGLMQQGDHSEAFLHSLRAMGVQLAIDDFGTGYSSLSHLKRFPVSKLKIDRSFIRDLMTDPTDAQLVNAMVAMGRSLGISVLAEGVETEAQLQRLKSIGCDAVQGYFLGRPEPATTARHWLRRTSTTADPPACGVWPEI